MPDIFSLLIANKYLMAAGATLLAAFYVYSKGYSRGKDKMEEKQSHAEKELSDRLRQIEAKNQTTDTKREENAKAVTAAPDVSTLIKLFDAFINKPPKGPKA